YFLIQRKNNIHIHIIRETLITCKALRLILPSRHSLHQRCVLAFEKSSQPCPAIPRFSSLLLLWPSSARGLLQRPPPTTSRTGYASALTTFSCLPMLARKRATKLSPVSSKCAPFSAT